jgi:hypothetical protein
MLLRAFARRGGNCGILLKRESKTDCALSAKQAKAIRKEMAALRREPARASMDAAYGKLRGRAAFSG